MDPLISFLIGIILGFVISMILLGGRGHTIYRD